MSLGIEFKYVRFEKTGFILFPRQDNLWHEHIGQLGRRYLREKIISAGFARTSMVDGAFFCYGMSESLNIESRPDDAEALNTQVYGEA